MEVHWFKSLGWLSACKIGLQLLLERSGGCWVTACSTRGFGEWLFALLWKCKKAYAAYNVILVWMHFVSNEDSHQLFFTLSMHTIDLILNNSSVHMFHFLKMLWPHIVSSEFHNWIFQWKCQTYLFSKLCSLKTRPCKLAY